MHIAEHSVIAVGRDHDDRMFAENAGKNLKFPLIGFRAAAWNGGGFCQQGGGRCGFRQVAVEGFAAMTVGTAGGDDDHAAFAADRFARGHAFHRLIDVLIERITAVACDYNIGFRNAHFAKRPQESAARFVRANGIPGECADDFLFRIDHHVDDEREFRLFRRKQHIAVNRIVFQVSGACIRTLNEFGTMIRKHGFP